MGGFSLSVEISGIHPLSEKIKETILSGGVSYANVENNEKTAMCWGITILNPGFSLNIEISGDVSI